MTRRALPVLLALALAACDEPVGSDQVALTVTVDPAIVPPGQASTITITILNYSAEPVTLRFDTSCRTEYAIVDSLNIVVATSPACTPGGTTVELGTNLSLTDTYPWPAAVTAAGTYRVFGFIGAPAQRIAGPATIVRQ